MNDLHINDQLPATIIDDQHTHTAPAVRESTIDPLEQTTLVNNRQTLLDVSRLGHGDDQAVVADVQDTVLLENRAQHGLHDDAGGRVADERALLVQLAREQIHAQIPVLARLRGHADANHLTGAALQQEYVADADEVALDGHAAATEPWLDEAHLFDGPVTYTYRTRGTSSTGVAFGDDDFVALDDATSVVVVVGEGVQDAIGRTLHPAAEAVVLAFVVVVAHFVVGGGGGIGDFNFFLLHAHVGCGCCYGATAFVFDVVGRVGGAAAVVALGDVELRLEGAGVVVDASVAIDVDFDVVSCVAAVNVDVDVGGAVVFGGPTVSVRCQLFVGLWSGSRARPLLRVNASGGSGKKKARMGLIFDREVGNIPFTREFYFGVSTVTLFVDADVFAVAVSRISVSGADVDFFPGESSIFPSAARGGVLGCWALCLNFPLDPSDGCCAGLLSF